MAVDAEGDGRRAVAEASGDGEHVEAGGDELRGMRMPEGMEAHAGS